MSVSPTANSKSAEDTCTTMLSLATAAVSSLPTGVLVATFTASSTSAVTAVAMTSVVQKGLVVEPTPSKKSNDGRQFSSVARAPERHEMPTQPGVAAHLR